MRLQATTIAESLRKILAKGLHGLRRAGGGAGGSPRDSLKQHDKLVALGESEEAQAVISRGLAEDRTNPYLAIRCAAFEARARNWEGCRSLLRQADYSRLKTAQACRSQALLWMRCEGLPEAKALLEKAIGIGGDHWEATSLLAAVCFAMGEERQALQHLQTLGPAIPRHAGHYLLLRRAGEAGAEGWEAFTRECRSASEAHLRAAPCTLAREAIEQTRAQLQEHRVRGGRILEALTTSPKATLLCPLHRLADLENALQQIERQVWPNLEVLLCINGSEITSAHVDGLLPRSSRYRVLHMGVQPNVAAVLNKALPSATGDYVLKLDADCIYYPSYTKDLVLNSLALASDLTCKRAKFRCWSRADIGTLEYPEFSYREPTQGDWVGGSAFCMSKRLLEKIQFNERFALAEDVEFFRRAVAGGWTTAFVDPFNQQSVEYEEAGRHTHEKDTLFTELQTKALLLGRPGIIESLARID